MDSLTEADPVPATLLAEHRIPPAFDPVSGEPLVARHSPEARRRRAISGRGADIAGTIGEHVGPRSRAFVIGKRVVIGVYQDGSIHAGNLAYMAILAIFPFFIVVSAIFSALGEAGQRAASVHAFLEALPPVVRAALEPVARDVMNARHGWLLWFGGIFGLWTVSGLIETIRDILRRAYGTSEVQRMWWRYRLAGGGITVLAVILLLAALYLQVGINGGRAAIEAHFHRLGEDALELPLRLSMLAPPAVLFGSLYLLFFSLTPGAYRGRRYPKWPGALLVTTWWGLVSTLLPLLLRTIFRYNLTYGSLAGVMISLFFFWLVGLGMVTGAELNAALAETPEERDLLGGNDSGPP